MTTHQATLVSDPADDAEMTNATAKATKEQKSPPRALDATLAPPDQRGGTGCCPWCLAASETFVHHEDGRVGCEHCDAAIPVGAEWYERGEKIVV